MRILTGIITFLLLTGPCLAAEPPVLQLTIHDQQFSPSQFMVPAGVRIRMQIDNQDALPAEFESYDLSREVIVAGKGSTSLYIGPLKPGSYGFFNDFNHAMQGRIVAQPGTNPEH
ncbi:MAG: cupredoxin domain-containing protein [Betaproteobacteria bacterium]|nr:cupredoxin domain-containing protein [Betaproteobacteria bacterium]